MAKIHGSVLFITNSWGSSSSPKVKAIFTGAMGTALSWDVPLLVQACEVTEFLKAAP